MAATLRLQPASVATQTAHLHALLRNARRGGKSEEDAVGEIADALLGNYRRWCARVGEAPRPVPQQLPGAAATAAWGANDCLLYLLLWGEAASLRHMPELIAWLYHHLASEVAKTGDSMAAHGISGPMVSQSPLTARAPKSFMDDVIVPIYNIAVQRMKEDKLTYDDLNEFFWSRDACARDGWQPFRSRRNCIVHPLRTARTHAEMHSWLHVLAVLRPRLLPHGGGDGAALVRRARRQQRPAARRLGGGRRRRPAVDLLALPAAPGAHRPVARGRAPEPGARGVGRRRLPRDRRGARPDHPRLLPRHRRLHLRGDRPQRRHERQRGRDGGGAVGGRRHPILDGVAPRRAPGRGTSCTRRWWSASLRSACSRRRTASAAPRRPSTARRARARRGAPRSGSWSPPCGRRGRTG